MSEEVKLCGKHQGNIEEIFEEFEIENADGAELIEDEENCVICNH